MATPGRNELCPCRSGKKYKHCCLGRAEPAMTETGRLAHVRNATERAVFDRILSWADRKFGRGWLDEPLRALQGSQPLVEDEFQFLMPWLVYHLPLQGGDSRGSRALADPGTPAEHFLTEQGDRLTPVEREALTAHARAHVSVWESRRVEPGEGVVLFDLLTHETRFVHEVRGTRMLPRWSALLASVVNHPEVSVFGAMYPHVLRPVQVERVLGIVRRMLGVRKRILKPVNLQGTEVQLGMVMAWRAATLEAEAAASEPRVVNNTDGDPVVLCTDHFDILSSTDDLLTSLGVIEGAAVQHTDAYEEVVFTKPGNKMHKSWDNTIVGRAVVSGRRLQVETNSVKRADVLRKRIETAAGTRLKRRKRDQRGIEDLLQNPPPGPRTPVPELPAEARAAFREVTDRMHDAWVDERVPALGGRTPRQAASSPTLRPRLVALLKEFEMHEAARPEAERYDVGRLWRALGIDPEHPAVVAVTVNPRSRATVAFDPDAFGAAAPRGPRASRSGRKSATPTERTIH